jgi:hypothetical protein
VTAQIGRVREHTGRARLFLDSHRYVHLLRFVWPLLLEMADSAQIAGVRTVREPVVLPGVRGGLLASLVRLNPVKLILLNCLSRPLARELSARGLATTDFSVGIMASGHMDLDWIERSLARIKRVTAPADPRVEVVFHPFQATRKPSGADGAGDGFYLSSERGREAETILSAGYGRLIAAHRTAAGGSDD